MTLHVAEDSETEACVWCTDVPPDLCDADVQHNVKMWAEEGDKVAIRALKLVPGYWIRMGNGNTPDTRCYRDGDI